MNLHDLEVEITGPDLSISSLTISLRGVLTTGEFSEEFFELDAAEPSDSDPSEANIGLMWYNAIIALADEDFLKIHQVTERPYRECLNFLNWKKAKAQREKLEILKRKNDLQRSFR